MASKETYNPKEGDCLSSLAVARNFDAEAVWNDQPGPIQKSLTSPNPSDSGQADFAAEGRAQFQRTRRVETARFRYADRKGETARPANRYV